MPTISLLQDVTGFRGEKIVELCLTDYSAFARPLFRPGFLGDKWPAVDFYVELNDVRGERPYFLIQSKATAANLTSQATSLRISSTGNERCASPADTGTTHISSGYGGHRCRTPNPSHTGREIKAITRIRMAVHLTRPMLVIVRWRSAITGEQPGHQNLLTPGVCMSIRNSQSEVTGRRAEASGGYSSSGNSIRCSSRGRRRKMLDMIFLSVSRMRRLVSTHSRSKLSLRNGHRDRTFRSGEDAFERICTRMSPATVARRGREAKPTLLPAWLRANQTETGNDALKVSVPLVEINEMTKGELKRQFQMSNGGVAAAG